MANDLLVLAAFIVCEAGFHQLERYREHATTTGHGILIAWALHPAATSAGAEWVNHIVAAMLTAAH